MVRWDHRVHLVHEVSQVLEVLMDCRDHVVHLEVVVSMARSDPRAPLDLEVHKENAAHQAAQEVAVLTVQPAHEARPALVESQAAQERQALQDKMATSAQLEEPDERAIAVSLALPVAEG